MSIYGRSLISILLLSITAVACANHQDGKLSIILQMPDPDPKTPFIGCLRDRKDDLLNCGLELACKGKSGLSLSQCRRENKARVVSIIAQMHHNPEKFLSDAAYSPLRLPLKFAKIEVQKSSGSWLTLMNKEKVFDISQFYLFETLAGKRVPHGSYKAIRISLNPSTYSVYFGPQKRGKWFDYPLLSDTSAAPVILIDKEFEFREGHGLDLYVTLDTKKMLVADKTTGIFKLRPEGQIVAIKGGGYTPVHASLKNVFDGGNVSVQAEPNTFTESVLFSAAKLTVSQLPKALPGASTELISAYDFAPSQTFSKPVNVTFKYDRAYLQTKGWSEKNLIVRFFDKVSNSWVPLRTTKIIEADQTISVSVNHFTIIALSAGAGFAVSMPSGFSVATSYELLNVFSQKVLPTIIPQLKLSDKVHTENQTFSGGLYAGGVNATFAPDNIPLRDLNITTSAYGADKVAFRIQLKRRISLGHLTLVGYSNGTENCEAQVNSCKSGCPSGWWADRSGAAAGCLQACDTIYGVSCFYPRSLLTFSVKKWYHYFADRLDLTVVLRPYRDSVGAIKFAYDGEYIQNGGQNGWLDLTPVEERPAELSGSPISSSLLNLLVSITNVVIDYFSGNILSGQMASLGTPMSAALSEAFGNVSPALNPNLVVNSQGIGYNADLYAEFNPVPDASFFCATSPSITPGPDTPAGVVNLATGNHIGLGLSLRTFEQVLTEIANRGYLCYNGDLGTPGELLQVTPNAAPTLTVDPSNYKMTMRLPVQVSYTSLSSGNVNATGALLIDYRIKMHIGASGLGIEFVGATHTFTHPLLAPKLDTYAQRLKDLKATYPYAFDADVDLPNPISNAGLGASMFRLVNFASPGGMMQLEFNVKGMELDHTTGNQPGSEWVVATKWTSERNECAPHLTGVPASISYQVPYVYISGYQQSCFNFWFFAFCFDIPVISVGYNTVTDENVTLDNGQKIRLASRNVHPTVWSAVQTNRTHMYGSCNTDGSFNLVNVLNDNFNTTPNGDIYLNQNFTGQQVGPAYQGIGQYAINIHNTSLEEVLLVIKESNGQTKLKWYLDNFFADYNNPKTYTGDLPASLGSDSLYLVRVLKRASPLNDRIQLNDKTYRIRVENDIVYLELDAPAQVLNISPIDTAVDVGLVTPILISFDKPVRPMTLTASTSTACIGSVQVSADHFVTCAPMTTAAPVMANGNMTATFLPTGLQPNLIYRVKITTAVETDTGVPLATEVSQPNGWRTASVAVTQEQVINLTSHGCQVGFAYNKQIVAQGNLVFVPCQSGIYSFKRASDGQWNLHQSLHILSSTGQYFGAFSAAAAGDYLAVWLQQGNENGVGIFRKDAAGTISQTAFLTDPDVIYSSYGISVGMNSTQLFVGAKANNISGRPGTIFVYDKDSTTENWLLRQRLADGDIGDNLAVTESILVASGGGAGQVYERDSSGNWALSRGLGGLGSGAGQHVALAISGTRIVAGKSGLLNPNDFQRRGAAVVFDRDTDGNWNQISTLVPSDPAVLNNAFGDRIAIINGRPFVSAWAQYRSYNNAYNMRAYGALYGFDQNPAYIATESLKIEPTPSYPADPAGSTYDGYAVDFTSNGNQIFAIAPFGAGGNNGVSYLIISPIP